MTRCDICGEGYRPAGREALQVCQGCLPNVRALNAYLRLSTEALPDPDTEERLLAEAAGESRDGDT